MQVVPFVEVATRPLYLSDLREERLDCPAVTRGDDGSSFLALTPCVSHFKNYSASSTAVFTVWGRARFFWGG